VRAVLRARYTRLARDVPGVLRAAPPTAKRQVPGWPDRRPPAAHPEAWVDFQMDRAERQLFDLSGGCRFCHRAKGARAAGKLPAYARSGIPDRWFARSRFRHESHHVLRCDACHPGVAGSRSAGDVLLPRIDTCRKCHNPRIGARSDCVACHLYHDRTKGRGQEGVRTIGECTGTAAPSREP
jgi:hypothetical protein